MIRRVNSINTKSSDQGNPSKRMRSEVLPKNKKQVYTKTTNIRIPAAAPATKIATHATSSSNVANRYMDTAYATEPPNVATNGSPNVDDANNGSQNVDPASIGSPNTNLTRTDSASVATTGTSSAASTENQATQRRNTRRGPNKCANLQGNAKTMVRVNANGQPNCRNARKFSSYLGLLARDPKLIPLDLGDWRKFLDEPIKETLWKIIQTRFTFEGPISPKDWTMDRLNHCLRSWRTKLKAKYYTPRKAKNVPLEHLIKPPNSRVDPTQWKEMVKMWESPKGQALNDRNAENRRASKMAHHLGTKSFARLREENAKDGKEPDSLRLFMIAYGQSKKSIDPQSAKIISGINDELRDLPPDCDIASERKRIFKENVGDDKRGYKRTFGIGVKAQITGTSKQKATEAMLMVEAERQKRQVLEDEVAAEKQKRIELENELAIQAEKRKELEEAVHSEKEKREALEDKVNKLSDIVLQIQGNGSRIVRV